MSRKVVVRLLILAGIVGVGVLGIGLWQLQQDPGTERVAGGPATTGGESVAERSGTPGEETADASAPEADANDAPAQAAAPDASDGSPAETTETASSSSDESEPTFDLMRVEPDGSTVVAGRSEAGAIVALLSNGKVVGKGIANAAGEFAIVLDTPLDPGAHAVTLETQDADGTVKRESRQSIAVSVPEDPASGEVLVMLNEPGAPSQVLQKPETETTTAMASPPAAQTDSASATAAASAATAQDSSQGPTETDTAEAPVQQPATPDAPAAPSSDQVADASQVTAPSETDTATAPTASDAAPAPETTAQAASSTPATETATETESASAGTDGQPAATAAVPRVTVEAVETEDSKVFVAGAGEPNSDVRVYFDNTLIGETTTDSKGRWLMESESEVAPGEVDVRADQIVPDSGTVVARAQVTFEKAEDAIVLRPVSATGAAGDGEGASASTGERQIPSIIIRSGDNLWTISQRRYGEGLRYTTIYQANRDQIRNPDLIYPGQVFMMPEGDRNWPAAN